MNQHIYKYNFLYKITNLINGKFYYGIHSTNDIDDGYMGSGVMIKKAIKKYGIENFKKEIIQFTEDRRSLILLEKQFINEELLKDKNCYNMVLGGSNFLNKTIGKITVKDQKGSTFNVDVNDPRRLTGEVVPILTGTRNVIDKDGNTYNVSIDDERIKTGEFFSVSKGKVTVFDKDGNTYYVSIKDPRYISGELFFKCPNIYGRKDWRWVTKNGIYKSIHKDNLQQYLNDGWVIGNNHKGMKCITKDGKNKRVKPDELQQYLNNGWKLGTNQKYPTSNLKSKGGRYIHKNGKCILIRPEYIEKYLNDGWELGMKPKKHS